MMSRHLFFSSLTIVALFHAISAFQRPTASLPLIRKHSFPPLPRIHSPHLTVCFAGENETDTNVSDEKEKASDSSKRQMLKFAVPALGIYLMQPLLSNIDNSFVGRTVGSAGLAALSPATLCIDQALYLFSFLSRATTGLASRAYASNSSDEAGSVEAARDAASPALTVSLVCGAALTLMYAFRTPALLQLLNVDPLLRTSATSYIHWRGATAWAAMAQNVCLSLFMVTRDVITPLKIISCAAVVNVIGDALFCVWPIRGGCEYFNQNLQKALNIFSSHSLNSINLLFLERWRRGCSYNMCHIDQLFLDGGSSSKETTASRSACSKEV